MNITSTEDPLDLKICSQIFNRLYNSDNGIHSLERLAESTIQIVRDGTEIIGFIVTTKRNKEIYIEKVCVGENYQDQGIGSELITNVLDDAKKEGLENVSTLTHRTSLFSRLGFIPEEPRHRTNHSPEKEYMNPINMVYYL